MSNPILEAALSYAERGWRVFPLRKQDKRPAIDHWDVQATTDVETIKRWFATGHANVAIATGNGLAAVDVDSVDGVTALSEVFGDDLPNTFTVKTSKGFHLYFNGTTRNGVRVLPGVDLRGDGGYIVAAPSVHPDGAVYEVVVDAPLAALPEFPVNEPTREAVAADYTVGEGGRNDFLIRQAGRLRNAGLDGAALLDALLALNDKHCRPALDATEVKSVAESADEMPQHTNFAEEEANEKWRQRELEKWAARTKGTTTANILATVGRQTLNDLPWGASPPQLVPPFLSPEGATILYGPGGVGKGYVSLWLALQLVRLQDKRVTIIDFETHPFEWGRRAHALGFKLNERAMVNYRAPFGAEWTAKRGSLSQVAAALRDDLDDAERYADYIIIDSYTTATSTGDAMGGMAGAQEFFSGVAMLGRPVLVIAHVAGGQEKFPAKPFGSVFVHNLARETWAVERVGDSDEKNGSMTLELRNMKANNQPKVAPQFLTFNFAEDGSVSVDREEPASVGIVDLVIEVLKRALAPMAIRDVARIIKADTGRVVSEDSLRKIISRHSDRFVGTEDTPRRWALRA